MDIIPATGHVVVAGAATSGTDRNSGVLDLAVDPDGRILVTGSLAGNLAVARIWP